MQRGGGGCEPPPAPVEIPSRVDGEKGLPVKLVRLRPLSRTRAGARTEAARGNAAVNKGGTTESYSRPLRAGVFVYKRET
jgi:hypothetical protein